MANLRRRSPQTTVLHDWARNIKELRGMKIAIVALARKHAGILYAMWQDATDFKGVVPGDAAVTPVVAT